MNKSDYNAFGEHESKWAFFPEAGLPTLVVCRSMPIGTIFFDTEIEAIDFKLNSLSIIQKELERRKRRLGYAEIDRLNEIHAEDERIFKEITKRTERQI